MSFWITQPTWQNFSSMTRESIEAMRAQTSIEKSHHLTSSLYFAIAALESFLNERMRRMLASEGRTEDQIIQILRKGSINDKLRKWPKIIIGSDIPDISQNFDLITSLNELRGELTHPKYTHHGTYEELSSVKPADIVDPTSEYIVKYCVAANEVFPYWVFGWNYLNPQRDSYDICLINEQQFMHSIRYLGYQKKRTIFDDFFADLRSLEGYRRIRNFLATCEGCEPKIPAFPYQPKLCRYWWRSDHHTSCGNVTEQAIQLAIARDGP